MSMGYGFGDPTDQRTLREKRLAERRERLATQAVGPLDGWVASVQAVVAASEPAQAITEVAFVGIPARVAPSDPLPKKKGGRPKGSKNKGKGDAPVD